MFELFDPKSEYAVREGSSLPHWFQPGVTYFVTFRTDDSVPQALLTSWHGRRDGWLRRNGINPRAAWKTKLNERPELLDEYHEKFTREFMDYLDRRLGACALRDATLAEIVAQSLRHFDGQRYLMGDFIVMPNHVHLLTCLLGDTEIEEQCKSWKRFTATRINQALGQTGRFWQEESFDHLVRSPEQFDYLRWYIANNPIKAGLREGEYLHYVRK